MRTVSNYIDNFLTKGCRKALENIQTAFIKKKLVFILLIKFFNEEKLENLQDM